MEHVEIIIIGAGVVGLAIARALALKGREVLILEAEDSIGSVTSSRNSGVIHAGLYYRPGSLKARVCLTGRDKLYAYAKERDIPYKRCGKLVVATSEDQREQLQQWKVTAEENGVTGLRMLSPEDVHNLEPEVSCVAAMLSPDTGIIDVHNYMLALLGDAEAGGATLVLKTPVTACHREGEDLVVTVAGEATTEIGCHILINAAGLGAQAVAHKIKGLNSAMIPPQVLAKGNYFCLTGKAPFKMLIYPLPVFGSSGLHATCDLSGRVRFGPDVEWVDHIDYRVDPLRLSLFEEAIRCYWPSLPSGVLQPDYSGIRPKIARGSPHDTDFIIHTSKDHGIQGLVNLYGIESPGLTSSLALADEVVRVLT